MLQPHSKKKNDKLAVTVKDRRDILFAGTATSVSSKNQSGPFDILIMHANFITLISEYIYIDRGLSTEKKFDIKNGVLTVISNNVSIYVGV